MTHDDNAITIIMVINMIRSTITTIVSVMVDMKTNFNVQMNVIKIYGKAKCKYQWQYDSENDRVV